MILEMDEKDDESRAGEETAEVVRTRLDWSKSRERSASDGR